MIDVLSDKLDNWEHILFLNTHLNNLRKEATDKYLSWGFKYESSILKEIDSELFIEICIISLNTDGRSIYFNVIIDQTAIKNFSENIFKFNKTSLNRDRFLEEIDYLIFKNLNYLNGLE